jgi:plasmid segregation protein ParM
MPQPVVRAIDVGYGQIKFTDGRDPVTRLIRTDSFPSASPVTSGEPLDQGVMLKKDNFIVRVNGKLFEVGRDIHLAMDANHDSEVMDLDFPLSDAYAARLYGAISYMLPGLPDAMIDQLVLGLPLNSYFRLHRILSNKFRGTHKFGLRGEAVTIKNCVVYPQPIGSYAIFMANHIASSAAVATPLVLIVDVGYNTVDWFVCQGMKANEARSGANQKGMAGVLKTAAKLLIQETEAQDAEADVVRRIDLSLKNGTDFIQYGKPVALDRYLEAASQYINDAAQAIRNSVGAGGDIHAIVLSGGGAKLYAPHVQNKFPKHSVLLLDDPAFANVRGFHAIGEKLAASAQRAMAAKDAVHG